MKNDKQTLWSCLHVVSESNQIGSLVMIDFLGILLCDDCFIGANEWFSEWWRRALLAKLVTVSATWGLMAGSCVLVSGQLTQLQCGPWSTDIPQKATPNFSSRSTCEGLRKTYSLLPVLFLPSCIIFYFEAESGDEGGRGYCISRNLSFLIWNMCNTSTSHGWRGSSRGLEVSQRWAGLQQLILSFSHVTLSLSVAAISPDITEIWKFNYDSYLLVQKHILTRSMFPLTVLNTCDWISGNSINHAAWL